MWIREELVPTCSLETDFPLIKLVAVITSVVGSDVSSLTSSASLTSSFHPCVCRVHFIFKLVLS